MSNDKQAFLNPNISNNEIHKDFIFEAKDILNDLDFTTETL